MTERTAYVHIEIDHPDLQLRLRGRVPWTPKLRELMIRTHQDIAQLTAEAQTSTDRTTLRETTQ